jgi:hypothetical protein
VSGLPVRKNARPKKGSEPFEFAAHSLAPCEISLEPLADDLVR